MSENLNKDIANASGSSKRITASTKKTKSSTPRVVVYQINESRSGYVTPKSPKKKTK